MEGVSETEFFIWFGALAGPLIAYGIWMRIKLMGSDEGEKFLQDREIASIRTKRKNRSLGGEYAETKGKLAKLEVGLGATKGAYGSDVSLIIQDSFTFFKYYIAYALVVALLAYMYFS